MSFVSERQSDPLLTAIYRRTRHCFARVTLDLVHYHFVGQSLFTPIWRQHQRHHQNHLGPLRDYELIRGPSQTFCSTYLKPRMNVAVDIVTTPPVLW